jgi:hypothetical protein
MIKEKYDWIKQKLIENPRLRDSNEQLYYLYLKEQGYDLNKPIKDFLKDMEQRTIPYLDIIGRTSRKVQENHPELRGKYYGLRKKDAEPKIKQEIREL